MRRLLPLLLLPVLAACAHYKLGSGSASSLHSIHVEPVRSEAALPQAEALVGSRIREAFLADGRLSLAGSPAEADATLSIKLIRYARDAAVAKPDDAGLARSFTLRLEASCELRARDGRVLFRDRRIEARRGALLDGGQQQSEYESLPRLAEDLARQATHAVLDTW